MIAPRHYSTDDFVEAYQTGRARIAAMVAGLTEQQLNTTVPTCPDWTVTQLCAHLAGVASALVNRQNPTGDLQGWIDGHVADRSDRSALELMAEWNGVGEQFEALIVKRPQSFAGLVYDVIAHEHDIALAVGTASLRTGLGVEVALTMALTVLEGDLASNGLGAITVVLGDGQWQAGEGEPALTLSDTTHFEALRLLGSRRSRAQVLAASWSGPAIAELDRYLAVIDHLGLPAADINE
jgi:uncharacterized protein (TIGR03083 family)